MERIIVSPYKSPVGTLIIGSYFNNLCLCDWENGKYRSRNARRISLRFDAEYSEGTSEIIELAKQQLDEYFSGKRTEFTVPIIFSGTEFQNKVWTELTKIPYGDSVSYAELAHRIGNPKSVRAVALANANNPISIFVPCHRVIGSNHKLTGYAGGLQAKRLLLNLESSTLRNPINP